MEFWWRWLVSLRRSFPDIWFSIYCFLLAKRTVQQKNSSTCQETAVEDLQTLKVLYEVTVAEPEMIAPSSYDMKIGFLRTNSGRVYFQAFLPAAFFFIMNKAKRTSCIMHGVFLFLAVYNTIFIFLYSFKITKD